MLIFQSDDDDDDDDVLDISRDPQKISHEVSVLDRDEP
jgi:hypothetical protein